MKSEDRRETMKDLRSALPEPAQVATQVAKEKLSKLTDDSLDCFAVRYVNYRQLTDYLRGGSTAYEEDLSRIELQFHGQACGFRGQSFSEWLDTHSANWAEAAAQHTDWRRSTTGIADRAWAIDVIREARKHAPQSLDKAAVRSHILQTLHDRVIEKCEEASGLYRSLVTDYHSMLFNDMHRVSESRQPRDSLELRDFLSDSAYSADEAAIIFKFLTKPRQLDRKETRDLLTIIADPVKSADLLRGDMRQYQIAVVFEPRVIDVAGGYPPKHQPQGPEKIWAQLKHEAQKHILGAAILSSDRVLTQSVIDDSMAAGERAFPVLNTDGAPVFPLL